MSMQIYSDSVSLLIRLHDTLGSVKSQVATTGCGRVGLGRPLKMADRPVHVGAIISVPSHPISVVLFLFKRS